MVGAMLPPAPCGGLFWYEQTPEGWVQHDVVPAGSDLFYHHGLITDIDQDGVSDMVTVGERRYLDASGRPVDDAQAQWFRGTTSVNRFESTPRAIGPGMGSLASLVDVDEDGDIDLLSAEYFADFEAKSFAWYEQTEAPSATNPNGTWTRHVIDDTVGPAIQMTMVPNFFGDGRDVAGVSITHKPPATIHSLGNPPYTYTRSPRTQPRDGRDARSRRISSPFLVQIRPRPVSSVMVT